jgi:hypothetical protein
MTGFDAAIAMGFLATGIASFARSVHVEMAGLILGTCPRTVMTELKSQLQRRPARAQTCCHGPVVLPRRLCGQQPLQFSDRTVGRGQHGTTRCGGDMLGRG